MSVETSESLLSIQQMEFFKFDRLLYYTNKYLEAKHGDSENNETSEQYNNMQQQMSASMRNMKNTFKMPTMPKYK